MGIPDEHDLDQHGKEASILAPVNGFERQAACFINAPDSLQQGGMFLRRIDAADGLAGQFLRAIPALARKRRIHGQKGIGLQIRMGKTERRLVKDLLSASRPVLCLLTLSNIRGCSDHAVGTALLIP